jgi:hypothetical protein
VTYLISDLYSVGPSENIKWFLYVSDVSEVEEGTVEGRHVRANMLQIGQELGASAAIIIGADGKPQRQFYDFLSQHLDREILDAVQLVTTGCMSMLATRRPLPHTDAMAIIPLSDRSKPFNTSERAAEVEANLRRIIDAIKDSSFQRLIDAEDALQIQQGHFNLPITDSGVVLLRKMNTWVRLKIPLLFAEVDVAAIIDDVLARRYPKVNH